MRRMFRLPQADEAFLDSLKIPWETVREGETRWLFLHDFPIGPGYTVEKATVTIRIDGGYPPGKLDMAWFHPALSRKDGVSIAALSSEQIDGRTFQRWSRHYPWREGVDELSTHIRRMEAWLRDEVMRRP
jgi:hypothetical protein